MLTQSDIHSTGIRIFLEFLYSELEFNCILKYVQVIDIFLKWLFLGEYWT